VGFLGEMVRDVVNNGHSFGLDVHYSFDGPAFVGDAGALKRSLPRCEGVFDALRGLVSDGDYAGVARSLRLGTGTDDGVSNEGSGTRSRWSLRIELIRASNRGTDPR